MWPARARAHGGAHCDVCRVCSPVAPTQCVCARDAQCDVGGVAARIRDLEPRIDGQLSHLRSDIKQALALAAASARAEAEAEAAGRAKEAEKRVMVKMHGRCARNQPAAWQ